MRKRKFVYGVLVFVLIGCGGAEAIADLFVADLSNDYKSTRNSAFVFSPKATNVNESDFTGTELDASGIDKEFTGHFLNYDIHFQFTTGPEKGVTYTGKFIKGSNPTRIVLAGSNSQPLTLTKDVQPAN